MALTRRPAVAGLFYPSDPGELEAEVGRHLAAVPELGDEPPIKALVAPHAGYVYSGPTAGHAFARVERLAGRVERVVLLGPAHRSYVAGLAVPSADRFETPLGGVPVDRAAVEKALELPQVTVSDDAHAEEHSLEVQLPFLQRTLGPFRLVPFAVGDATPADVAEVLELLWGGPETLVLVSSDLSHYHDYQTARRLDAATTSAIEALRPEDLGRDSACGRIPVGGLLLVAARRGLRVRTLDLTNSGDTAGPRDRVVGYGAYAFG